MTPERMSDYTIAEITVGGDIYDVTRSGLEAMIRERGELKRCQAEIEKLREALRPFAEYATHLEGFLDGQWVYATGSRDCRPTVGDCRKAKEVLG